MGDFTPDELRFRILGPLEVTRRGRPVPVSADKQRALLAGLLLWANRPVSIERLADWLWSDDPPANAKAAIQSYVARLRRVLGDTGELVVTGSAGYLIRIGPEQLDLITFDALLTEAAAAGDTTREANLLTRALALWRGEPLSNIRAASPARAEVDALVERQLLARERLADALLRLGQHAALVPELRTLTANYPLRERFWAQLIMALYRSGRQAEALDAYRSVVALLAEELGIDPSAELREVHRAVLAGDATPPSVAVSPLGPNQLPLEVRGFTGRAAELARLDALLGSDDPVVITAIAGTAGVGKTALAIRWARSVADRFPDGQLWVNLRGYDPEQPLLPGQALTMFLRALGVPGGEIPLELEAQSALFRSLLTGKRVLIVLDNASDPEQVRPILPGSPGCLVLVTSRDELSGLIARDGATRVRLDALAEVDAVALLRRLLGVDAHVDALRELARLCARLPLALRVAADRINASNGRPLSSLVTELASDAPMDAFAAGGDPRAALRTVFSWSYRALSRPAAVLFRRLGVIPGPDFDVATAGALIDTEARPLLDVLAGAHLIERRPGGRFAMHDLLRAYAVEQAEATESEATAVTTRLLDHYLHTAAAAMDSAFPHERHRRPKLAGAAQVTFTDPERARAWLDTERASLAAAVTMANGHGLPWYAMDLAATVYRYLIDSSQHADALVIHNAAVLAARAVGDRPAEASALTNLGSVYMQLACYPEAFEHYEQALRIFRETGDRSGEARVLGNLGLVHGYLADYHHAHEHHELALAITISLGDLFGQSNSLNSLGILALRHGRYPEAVKLYERALVIRREIGDRSGEADAMGNLGEVHARCGLIERAVSCYEQALELARDIGYPVGEAALLGGLSLQYARLGRGSEARSLVERALAMARDVGAPQWEADALSNAAAVEFALGSPSTSVRHYTHALRLADERGDGVIKMRSRNGLGQALIATGRPEEAVRHLREALDLSRALEDPYEEACALRGLADIQHAVGDRAGARTLRHEALELFERLGVPEAGEVRALC